MVLVLLEAPGRVVLVDQDQVRFSSKSFFSLTLVVLCGGGETFSPVKSELDLLPVGFIQSHAAVLLPVLMASVTF